MPETLELLQQADPLEGDLAALLSRMRMQETLLTLDPKSDGAAYATSRKVSQA